MARIRHTDTGKHGSLKNFIGPIFMQIEAIVKHKQEMTVRVVAP